MYIRLLGNVLLTDTAKRRLTSLKNMSDEYNCAALTRRWSSNNFVGAVHASAPRFSTAATFVARSRRWIPHPPPTLVDEYSCEAGKG